MADSPFLSCFADSAQIDEIAFAVAWLVKIKISDPSELEGLLGVDAYKALIGA